MLERTNGHRMHPGNHGGRSRMTRRTAGLVAVVLGAASGLAQGQQRDTQPQPVSLPPAAATAKAPTSDFERRMMEGKGQFITREQLDRAQAKRLGDVISQLRGIRVFRPANGEAHAMSSRGQVTIRSSNVRCYVQVYLDDALVFSGSQPGSAITGPNVFNLNTLSPSQLEGVEYYSGLGNIPPKYNATGSVCGVLLLWTRQR